MVCHILDAYLDLKIQLIFTYLISSVPPIFVVSQAMSRAWGPFYQPGKRIRTVPVASWDRFFRPPKRAHAAESLAVPKNELEMISVALLERAHPHVGLE
ncbi:hypothetical protein M9434_002792 [Picochlorum sp. BPE23]|nr:hypothetical protein M9434_002792 [Picochlorum sp. BPE23]